MKHLKHELHRQIITIRGKESACLKTASDFTQNLNTISVDDYKIARKYLGQEFDAVVINLHKGFDANAFGAITGTIRGGGALLLLSPEDTSSSDHINSRFLQRFNRLLFNHPFVQQFYAGIKVKSLSVPSRTKSIATPDQNNAVDAIFQVVEGHRRRPLLITSDRGRGKSASLGIAADKLLQTRCQHIVVCAPSKKTAEIVFKHAGKHEQLHFYAPDELLRQKPETDLLLIDEAAAIPLKLLTQFLRHYSRIVFSTTEHGYEGSGRGFATRFRKILDQQTPNWKHCKLATPIRWKQDDPLEQFTFNALLMDAEPITSVIMPKLSERVISRLDSDILLKNERQLKNLFGLLVAAHYQTRPSDLQYMLDDPSVKIYVIQAGDNIIATALVAREGGFSKDMATEIYKGKRRPKGNLVAQALAANAGAEYAPCLKGDRIVRIAVHPDLQGEGFGTDLLKFISNKSGADYVSSCFGATTELLSFWKKSGFTPVNVGMKRDASSGSHSVIMLKAQNNQGVNLLKQTQQRFCKYFPHLLADPLADLEADLVFQLLCSDRLLEINKTEKKEIVAFATQQRAYESSLYPIWKLVCKYYVETDVLSKDEQKILVLKVLQKQLWLNIVKKLSPDINGKKQAMKLLRQAVFSLYQKAF